MKKGLIFLIWLVGLFSPSFIWAADLEVVFESDPLFSQAVDGHWYPSRSETRWVQVKNNSAEAKMVIMEAFNEMTVDTNWDLAAVLELVISAKGDDLYGGSLGKKYLADFYNETELPLSVLASTESTTYEFMVSLVESTGNDWQGRDTGFDLKIGFSSEPAPTPTPTPTPTSTPTPVSIPATGVTDYGSVQPGPPVCNAISPVNTPFLWITETGVNSVSLAWTAVSPASHYLIAYGSSSGDYLYGNPNVGLVTSYTVSGLSGETDYYFVVRGINDCAPGSYSNEVSATPAGAVLAGLPPGFVSVLGEATPSAEWEEEGAGGEARKIWWLWFLLGLPLVYFWWRGRKT